VSCRLEVPVSGRSFDVIAFDADDTLWHNERSYRNGRERFQAVLAQAGVAVSEEEVDLRVNQTEVRNLEYFGYGVSSFVMSLIETAIELTDGRITGGDIRELIELAKQMLTEEVVLFEGAREAVMSLARSHPLMLITKGDLLHQTSKLERSGLQEYFRFVEVVSQKTPAVYAGILARHGLMADTFLMVGNSIRSDIVPVLELGGCAVHVPAELSWSHEHAEVPETARDRCFELASLHALPSLVTTLQHPERE
jgi:putative hydrolase of the HAD superfamily